MRLINEKVSQAVGLLKENSIDCWITFVRESALSRDPMLSYLTESDVTWHSAFIVTSKGATCAIVGNLDRQSIEDLGVYQQVRSYVEGIKSDLQAVLKEIDPRTIAVNYSKTSEVCDGLTHGMYLTLRDYLAEIGFEDRLVSSETIVSSLRARKSEYEIDSMQQAINHTLEIFELVKGFIAPDRTEKEIAAFMLAEVERRGLELAWDRAHCPAVFTGPDTAGAHYKPTDRKVARGHVLNMDFGVKVNGYCSDLQRTFYVLEEGEDRAPAEVIRGFDTITTAIENARQALRPGVQGHAVDAVARGYITDQGYEEYPHGLGHQVGQFAHDGTALLGPTWEKYANKPFETIEEGMVFTIEPRLTVPRRGVVTIEEMVVVRAHGASYLSKPQRDLILIR